jgi:hypothetical protein
MHYYLAYLKHLLKATNQHGVHSPFVYDFLTKGLYKKPKIKTSKSLNVLYKSIPYFNVKSIQVLEDDEKLQNQLTTDFKLKTKQNPPFDLIYMENTNQISKLNKAKTHNDTVIMIDQIHTNKSSNELWKSLCTTNDFSVSIDFFHCGLLFFRKEQVKQHFIIRI